jgi:cell division septation protein DedD
MAGVKERSMKAYLIGLLAALLFIGCAERQEEAEKLGQEVMEQEAEAVDTMAPDESVIDSSAIEELGADASAIPEGTSSLTEAPAGEGYTVQVAACEDYEYAQHLLDLYRRRGYEPYGVRFDHEGQAFYRVRIGSFENAAEAAALKTELIDKYSIEAWVDWKSD